jgi:hypothetical protein
MVMPMRFFASFGISIALAGCGRKAHDAADGEAPRVDASAASSDGVNANDVKRFSAEIAIDHEAAKLGELATVRVAPPRGEPIVNIEAGTDVQKLASFGDAFLVSFTSPKTGNKTMGWIPQSAIAVDAGAGAAGAIAAPRVLTNRDAGLVAIADSGVKRDAAAAVVPVVATLTVDAGKAPATHKQCPANQALAKILDNEECLAKCKTQADCPTKTFCTSGVLADPPGQTAKLCFKVSN